ncbi:MAG: GNAT family N-acetyltransferase [Candidatus Bathyarchaeia archaeon]
MESLIPRIRSLHRDELEESWELHKKGFPHFDVQSRESYLRYRSKEGFDFDQIVVAEVGGKLVGKIEVYSAKVSEKGKTGFVDGFVVDPDYRKRGIGTQLLLEAERRAVNKGIRQIHLGVKTFNKDAVSLYEELGYERLNRFFLMRVLKDDLQIPELPNDVLVRSAVPWEDPERLIGMIPSVEWGKYATQEELRADLKENPGMFLVLEHNERVQAYIKYSLGKEIHVNSLGISREAMMPLPAIVQCILKEVLAKAAEQKSVSLYVQADRNEARLMKALESLGFGIHDTTLQMRKKIN